MPLIPRMSTEEIGLLDTCLNMCRGNYFEFGCGGSTYKASTYQSINHITSVDSSRSWIDVVSNEQPVCSAIKACTLKFIHIDINANDSNWGYPKDKSKLENWSLYSRAINSENMKYDLVLIDGRFRVSCALHTLSSINPSSLVLIHDYTVRPQYHCVEKFYDKLLTVDTMVVLRKKSTLDASLLQSMIQKYEHVCE